MNDTTARRPRTITVRSYLMSNMRNYSMVIMLALIMIIFSFLTGGVNLNSRNITNIFMQNSYILLLAVGMVQVIIIGNIAFIAEQRKAKKKA